MPNETHSFSANFQKLKNKIIHVVLDSSDLATTQPNSFLYILGDFPHSNQIFSK